MISSNDIRRRFLAFFASRGHTEVPSSPLVPANDPTLLFTNAGMVQFKDCFLGREQRSYQRAASSQRCVRAGGKHNDLENVGYTARHHTFFEMLGNFSFGDYFKKDAIAYAWEFLTVELGLPPEKLWITVFDEDAEAERIWLEEVGADPSRLSRIGAKDNFWAMGETGPCGPCSEIFYDHGDSIAGGPPGTPEEDGDRYVEIWNLVFMQYDRAADGSLQPLPSPSVDTGMGLERMAAVLQGVHDNYDTDQFVALLEAVRKLAPAADPESRSMRVIADHIRACSFLIIDSILPSNEGRGFVLRRIIRRAIRHGFQLGLDKPFFHQLVAGLIGQMGEAYPELKKQQAHIERVLLQEEQRFAETLAQGMKLLDKAFAEAGDTLDGETAFRLYDTYGFPFDLTQDVARERGVTVDQAGFEAAMEAQRERARSASQFAAQGGAAAGLDTQSGFDGYHQLSGEYSVVALVRDGQLVEQLQAGENGQVVLEATPFYAESGGQVGDQGELQAEGLQFTVADTQKDPSGAILHQGRCERGTLAVGQRLQAVVDAERRAAIIRNHSATHLLHAALREVLGDHVQQKGSLVAPDRLRFDFAHYQGLTGDELSSIEQLVNREVLRNSVGEVKVSGYQQALDDGAIALFGEKYGEEVRVMRFGDFSCELCGGTHVTRTGDIGLFKIVSEAGIASGVRRIEALTGYGALSWAQSAERALNEVANSLKASRDELLPRISQMQRRSRELERELDKLRAQAAADQGGDLLGQAVDVDGVAVITARIDGTDGKALREMVDDLKNRLQSGVIVLGAAADGKVQLIAGVTDDHNKALRAGDLINHVAAQVGGRGGGRADMAQAGGSQPENLDAALDSVSAWVAAQVAS